MRTNSRHLLPNWVESGNMTTQAPRNHKGGGYVFKDNQGRWFARITVRDLNGVRRNIKRKAIDKSDALKLLGRLADQIQQKQKHFSDTELLDWLQSKTTAYGNGWAARLGSRGFGLRETTIDGVNNIREAIIQAIRADKLYDI